MTSRLPGPAVGLSVLLSLAAVAGLAAAVGQVESMAVAATSGGLLGLAAVLCTNEDVASGAAAAVLFVLAAVGLTAAVIWAVRTVTYDIGVLATAAPIVAMSWQSAVLVLAGALAAFGAVTLPSRRDATDAVDSLAGTAGLVTVVIGLVLAVAASRSGLGAVGAWWGPRVGAAATHLLDPPAATAAPGPTLLLLGVAVVGTAALLGALPESALAGRLRRAVAADRIERASRWGVLGGVAATVLGVVVLALPDPVWRGLVPAGAPHDLLVAATTAPGVRLALAIAILATAVATAAMALHERIRTRYLHRPKSLAAQVVGAVAVVLGLLAVGPAAMVAWLTDSIPDEGARVVDATVAETSATVFVFAVTVAACVALTAATYALAWLRGSGVLRAESASPVLAACGVAVAAVMVGMVAGPSLLLPAAVAAAVLVWELGAYGRTLGEEVGFAAPTRRAEVVHAGALVPVAVVAVAVVWGGTAAIGGAGESGAGAIAALVAATLLAGLQAR